MDPGWAERAGKVGDRGNEGQADPVAPGKPRKRGEHQRIPDREYQEQAERTKCGTRSQNRRQRGRRLLRGTDHDWRERHDERDLTCNEKC